MYTVVANTIRARLIGWELIDLCNNVNDNGRGLSCTNNK